MAWRKHDPEHLPRNKRHPKRRFHKYQWPFWKVGLKHEDLFCELHERFNTASMFIQDPDAYHKDVCEIAYRSTSKEDFYARLRYRSDMRLEEFRHFVNGLLNLGLGGYHTLKLDQSSAFLRFMKYTSTDCLVAFLASFVTPDKRGRLPSECKSDAFPCHVLFLLILFIIPRRKAKFSAAWAVKRANADALFFENPDTPTVPTGPTLNPTERAAGQSSKLKKGKKRRRRDTDMDGKVDVNIKAKRRCTETDASTATESVGGTDKGTQTTDVMKASEARTRGPRQRRSRPKRRRSDVTRSSRWKRVSRHETRRHWAGRKRQ